MLCPTDKTGINECIFSGQQIHLVQSSADVYSLMLFQAQEVLFCCFLLLNAKPSLTLIPSQLLHEDLLLVRGRNQKAGPSDCSVGCMTHIIPITTCIIACQKLSLRTVTCLLIRPLSEYLCSPLTSKMSSVLISFPEKNYSISQRQLYKKRACQ